MDVKSIQPMSFGQIIVKKPIEGPLRKEAYHLLKEVHKLDNNAVDKCGIDLVLFSQKLKTVLLNINFLSVLFKQRELTDVSYSFFRESEYLYPKKNWEKNEDILNFIKSRYERIISLGQKYTEISKNEELAYDEFWNSSRSLRHKVVAEGYTYSPQDQCAYKTIIDKSTNTTQILKYPQNDNALFEFERQVDKMRGNEKYIEVKYHPNGVVAEELIDIVPGPYGEEDYHKRCYNDKGILIFDAGRGSDAWYDWTWMDSFDPDTGKRIESHYDTW